MFLLNRNFVKRASEKNFIITDWENLKKNIQNEKELPVEKRQAWIGFIPYDTGASWHGIKFAKSKFSSKLPEVYFVAHHSLMIKADSLPGHNLIALTKLGLEHQNFCLSKSGPVRPYLRKIKKIKEYLRAGDTYQVNFSQKFSAPLNMEAADLESLPLSLFLTLSRKNPSPHEFFMDTPEFSIISNSPERLCRGYWREGRFMIETRPIKGTVPRGLTPKEDARNIERLLRSEKEKAELVMIVDLERNDIGKIAVPGTVTVTEHRTIEKYSHVIHTVSNIEGELRHNLDACDVLEALFPGGSVTGCPKKRTMEIIAELEGEPRGVYCGSAGIIYPDGSFDFNIMIRTAFIEKNFDNKPWFLSFRSGGGITIGSHPEREYEETLHKAQAFFETLK